MGCLDVSFVRIGGDLEVQFQRAGGDLSVSLSSVCGVDAGLSLLASSDQHLLSDNDDDFLSVTINE